MKKILIALDYDASAQKVAEAGHSLAVAMNADVVLLHVIADPVYYTSTVYSPIMGFGGFMDVDLMQPNIMDLLEKTSLDFLNTTKIHLGDDTIKTMVTDGDFAVSILSVAKELNADIIVMGSHSRKWLENIVLGSVAEKVLHDTTIPLFIIPIKKTQ
jgi:nucleotide-binding universal stress UspA family protein